MTVTFAILNWGTCSWTSWSASSKMPRHRRAAVPPVAISFGPPCRRSRGGCGHQNLPGLACRRSQTSRCPSHCSSIEATFKTQLHAHLYLRSTARLLHRFTALTSHFGIFRRQLGQLGQLGHRHPVWRVSPNLLFAMVVKIRSPLWQAPQICIHATRLWHPWSDS